MDGAVFERTSPASEPDTLGSTLTEDRLTYSRNNVETTALKRKKGLSVLKAKAKAAKGIEQRDLFLPYQSVVLSVTA